MVLSMTGYGKGTYQTDNYNVIVEIKSLNGKTTDVRCRIPSSYKQEEIDLRKLILAKAYRGKMDYNVTIQSDQAAADFNINESLFKKYYQDLSRLSSEVGSQGSGDYTEAILRIPNVVDTQYTEVSPEEYEAVVQATEKAIIHLNEFRASEGQSLLADLQQRSANILSLLEQVTTYEGERIEKIKEKMKRNVEDVIPSQQVDKNRFEQEIIYYLEKLDINEEKVRLSQHCKYFDEILNSDKIEVGKKLAFIAQEMGREINTLGAKAQHKNIQQIVVSMKDELEKIKEQLFNVV